MVTVAQWSKALTVHMKYPLNDALKASAEAAYPDLRYFRTTGDPHNAADQGFADGEFCVSFPIKGVWLR